MPDGSSAGRGTEVMAGSDRVVLRRLAVRPKPRRTTLIFGVSQMILGLAIVAISFTAFALSTSNRVRNACPYWAGFSVLLTGGVGLIAWKQPSSLALSFFTFLSAVCVVLHLVATALSGLSGADLQTLVSCRDDLRPLTCHCCETQSRCARQEDMVVFEGVADCTTITGTVKELMYSVCITNIVACVICIAATIIGCAYIVKRHTARRMVVRRSQCSNLARDSFFSDIIMPTDSVFTPPLAPPPPYSPPDYTAISNDRVLVESNEFMDDLSTPTPVIGPQDMPPPYSTLDLSPGGTVMECPMSQEYQVDPNEIHRFESRRLSTQTAISNSYNPGRAIITVCQRSSTEQIPTPPLRWDSHHFARITPLTRMEQSGGSTIEPQPRHHHTANVPAPGQIINNNRRHTKSKSRPRSGGSPRASPRHQRSEARQSLPAMIHRNGESNGGNFIIVDDGIPVQSRIRPNNGGCLPVVIMRHHRGRPPQGNRVSTASQTSLEGLDNIASSGNTTANTGSINVGDKVIRSIPCSVSREAASRSPHSAGFHDTNERTGEVYDNSAPADYKPEGAPVTTGSGLMDRKASSSSGSVSGPPTSVPSQTKSSSSNERLTGTSSSHTSRDSASAVGRKQRRRHSRHAAERRRVSSSTTCSTSPTDCSSRSSTSGSFGQSRRRSRGRYISTSSSSDSEVDQRPHPPRRVVVARMANGGVWHEMLDPNNAYNHGVGAIQREHRHRKSSGSSANTPPRGRPKLQKTSGERAGSGSRRTNSSGPSTRHDTRVAQGASQTPIIQSQPSRSFSVAPQDSAEQVHLRQKRPNSLNLRLSRKSHPAAQLRPSHQATVTFVEESDPWIHRDAGRTYASVGVQSTPDQTQTQTQTRQTTQGKSSQTPATFNPPQTLSAVSAPTPSTNVDPLAVPKPKPRPKSMVELSQDTSVIVSSFLRQAVHGLSPAIKTVLEDIQSVITTDEQYLAEAMQSHSIIDEYIEKSNSLDKLPKEKKGTDAQLPDPKVSPPVPSPVSCKELKETLKEKCGMEDSGILPVSDKNFPSNCPEKDLIGISGSKHEAVLQECLVKTLESARETIL